MFENKEKTDNKTGPLGYAVTYIEDFGAGRQVQVAFGLHVGAPKEVLDAEMDKLRLVMNRQKAFGVLRDVGTKLASEEKVCAAIQELIDNFDDDVSAQERIADEAITEMKSEMEKLPKTTPTLMRQQHNNLLTQAQHDKARIREKALEKLQGKKEELAQRQTNIMIFKDAISEAKKEIQGETEE